MTFHEGTLDRRCDHCKLWSAISTTRVLGWCTYLRTVPTGIGMTTVLDQLTNDALTSYNQACDHIELNDEQKP